MSSCQDTDTFVMSVRETLSCIATRMRHQFPFTRPPFGLHPLSSGWMRPTAGATCCVSPRGSANCVFGRTLQVLLLGGGGREDKTLR